MNWRAVLAIARKDIGDAIKNLYVLFQIVLPIVASLLLRLVFPSGAVADTLAIAVYDPGGSRLVAELRELPQVELLEVALEDHLEELS